MLIKKNSETLNPFEKSKSIKRENLFNDYEQMREYFLSPIKTPSRPLGFDLWIKKGFLSWGMAIFGGEHSPECIDRNPETLHKHKTEYLAEIGNDEIQARLLNSLTNILIDWSDKNDRQQN